MLVAPLPQTVNASDVSPERLAGNTALTEQQKIAEASRQFEAILLRQILAATQKPVIPSKFVENSTSADIYRDMITHELAESISKSGAFGLAKTFEHQLTRPEQAATGSNRPDNSAAGTRTSGSTSASPGTHPVDHHLPTESRVPRNPIHSAPGPVSGLISDSRSSSFRPQSTRTGPAL